MTADVRALAEDWLAQDPDAETREELVGLLTASDTGDAAARAELEDRFGARLAFGTAGLRGAIATGSNRMNRVLVSQAAVGLADHLLAQGLERPVVVIGYDGRKNSRVFAEDSAALMAGVGVDAVLLPRLLPTPVLAFAVRYLSADAGVMVTASHNPPQDNGYKVYLGGADEGSQIVPPVDSEIAERILAVARTKRVPELPRGEYRLAEESVVTAYIEATAALGRQTAPLRVVYGDARGRLGDCAPGALVRRFRRARGRRRADRARPRVPHGGVPEPGGGGGSGSVVRDRALRSCAADHRQ